MAMPSGTSLRFLMVHRVGLCLLVALLAANAGEKVHGHANEEEGDRFPTFQGRATDLTRQREAHFGEPRRNIARWGRRRVMARSRSVESYSSSSLELSDQRGLSTLPGGGRRRPRRRQTGKAVETYKDGRKAKRSPIIGLGLLTGMFSRRRQAPAPQPRPPLQPRPALQPVAPPRQAAMPSFPGRPPPPHAGMMMGGMPPMFSSMIHRRPPPMMGGMGGMGGMRGVGQMGRMGGMGQMGGRGGMGQMGEMGGMGQMGAMGGMEQMGGMGGIGQMGGRGGTGQIGGMGGMGQMDGMGGMGQMGGRAGMGQMGGRGGMGQMGGMGGMGQMGGRPRGGFGGPFGKRSVECPNGKTCRPRKHWRLRQAGGRPQPARTRMSRRRSQTL